MNQPKETTMIIEPHIDVVLTVDGRRASFYQPVEGGWRCQRDGSLRTDSRGMVRTFPDLESAAQAMHDLFKAQ